MSRSYSFDLRVRVIRAVEEGMSARAASERFGVSISSGIRWVRRFRQEGSLEARPQRGHLQSPLEPHRAWLMALIAVEPDLTLVEIGERLAHDHGLTVAISTIWRFYDMSGISFKKSPARRRAGSRGRGNSQGDMEKGSAIP
jgi:transposase